MEFNPTTHACEQIVPIVPQRWDYRLAEYISRMFSPPLVATAALFLATPGNSNRAAIGWGIITFLLIIFAPAAYLIYLHRSGQITDLDVYVRQQRVRPYLLSIGCCLVTFGLLWHAHAPASLQIIAAAALLETSGLFLVNLKWKISAHAAAIAGFSSLGYWVGGISTLPMLILLPLVAWSRLHLKRHTFSQTIVGILWGMISFTLVFWLLQ